MGFTWCLQKMRSMFAGEVVEFDVIIKELQLLENEINNTNQ